MVEDQDKPDKKEDTFDSAGEAIEYLSMDQARVLAIRHARENTEFYSRRYRNRDLVWEVAEADEDEDFYHIRLTHRPALRFDGEPGVELLTIDKVGEIEIRQLLSEPRQKRRWWVPATGAAVLAVAAILAAVGLIDTSEPPPSPTPIPTPASVPAVVPALAAPNPTPTLGQAPAIPLLIDSPTAVPISAGQPVKLTSPRGYVTVDMPAGSAVDGTALWYQPVTPESAPVLPPDFIGTGKVFDLQVTGDQQAEGEAYEFAQPVTITVALSDADVASARGDGSNLVLQHLKTGDTDWTPLPTSADLENRTASAKVSSFSVFALSVRAEPTPTPTAPVQFDSAPTETPLPTPTITPTPSPTATVRPTATPTPTPTRTPAPSVTATPTSAATPTPSPTTMPTPAPTQTPTPSPTFPPAIPPTATPTVSGTPEQPNLRPATPSQWDASLVVSRTLLSSSRCHRQATLCSFSAIWCTSTGRSPTTRVLRLLTHSKLA